MCGGSMLCRCLFSVALVALVCSAQQDGLAYELPISRVENQKTFRSQRGSYQDGDVAARPRRRQLLGRYSARDPERFDFFGEHREEQCQDDMDCRQLVTGRVCDRKPNDAAGYCRCPDDKPVKITDNGRIKCVTAKVEEPRCTSTAECTAINPYLQCVDQKCACVSPNVMHEIKGCVPGEIQSGKTASWMAPLAFLFTILAIMTCTFFVTRYRKEDDGLEEQILSDSPQGSAALEQPLQQRVRRPKTNYARLHQWFNNLIQPQKPQQSTGSSERKPPIEGPQMEPVASTSAPQSLTPPGTVTVEPEEVEGVLAAECQAKLRPNEQPDLRTSQGVSKTSEDFDHRKSFLPLPFSMAQRSLRNVAKPSFKEAYSKSSHCSIAEADNYDISTGQRYRATIRSPHLKDDTRSDVECVALLPEDRPPVVVSLDSQDKVNVPLPALDSAHQASSSSSNDIKLPSFSRMSRHYESEDASALKIRPGDLRAVPVHVKRLKRGLEMLRTERQQKTGNLQHLLDGRDLYEREEMSPLDSSSGESALNARPNSVSRNVQTDITVSAAIPVLPFASLNVLSPMPAIMKPSPTPQLGCRIRGQDIPITLLARTSSTDAGDGKDNMAADSDVIAGNAVDSDEGVAKQRFSPHGRQRQPVIFEEQEIPPERAGAWTARQQNAVKNKMSSEVLQVLQVTVEPCRADILGSYNKQRPPFPDGAGAGTVLRDGQQLTNRPAQERTPSVQGEGASDTFPGVRNMGNTNRALPPEATLKTRSCYSVNKEAVLYEGFPDGRRGENFPAPQSANTSYAMDLKTSPNVIPQAPGSATQLDEFSCGIGMPDVLFSQEANADFASHSTLSPDKGYSAGEGSYKSFEVESQLEESKGVNDVGRVS